MRAFTKPFFRGMIIKWYGAVANIRKGWVLCDGNNGTPDLLGLSVIGAGGSFNPNDTGGEASHVHALTLDAHTHTRTGMNDIAGGTEIAVGLSSNIVTGAADSKSTRSPYHALCFIMKT